MNLSFLSGACIVHQAKVLILQQGEGSLHAGKWGPPGGHAKKGETLIQAAIREIKEETGLTVKIIGLVQIGIKTHSDGKVSVLALFYVIPLNPEQIKINRPEISDYKWVGIDDLKKNRFPLRDVPFLKPPLIKALQQNPSPIDTFQILSEENW